MGDEKNFQKDYDPDHLLYRSDLKNTRKTITLTLI